MKKQETREQFSLMHQEANYFSEQINKSLDRFLTLINQGLLKKAEDEAYRAYDFCCGLVDAIEVFNSLEICANETQEFLND